MSRKVLVATAGMALLCMTATSWASVIPAGVTAVGSTSDIDLTGTPFTALKATSGAISLGGFTWAQFSSTNGHTYGAGAGYSGDLGSLMGTLFTSEPGWNSPCHVTVTGLDASQTYMVQALVYEPWGRGLSYDIDGTALGSNSGQGFDVKATVTGVTQFTFTDISTSGNTGAISGLIVTPVPEPVTMALLAMGGVSVLLRRKRR